MLDVNERRARHPGVGIVNAAVRVHIAIHVACVHGSRSARYEYGQT
jgi:hypothetical protein